MSAGSGAAPFLPARASARTYLVEDAPHAWLFPRVTAVMHHGGAGTTAEGVRAGVPSIIFPQAVDQHFWAQRVARLGTGPRPLGRRDFTPGALARIFRRTAVDQGMHERARLLGERVRAENGVARAVELLLPILG